MWGSPLIFPQRLKIATTNLICSLGLPRAIIKLHQEKKWAWPWARGASKILEFTFKFFATAEASDFKFGMQFEFLRPIIKLYPDEKVGVALG